MNKYCYRVIFNKARGLLMAVAETVRSPSKKSEIKKTASNSTLIAPLKPLTFLIWSTLGMVFMPTVPTALAQIVANPNAPAQQQPNIISAPNGTTVVNIQTPSAAGVSRNTYNQFDVQQQGAILNNARTNTQTQLGGWVQGNAALAGGAARIILNEVNSANTSQLNGYVEVAGQRAQVIIANPAGISCDGCGFINATRATLTTGTPVLNNGDLSGYRVQGGRVTIAGAGMDSSTADYTDILARSVKVDAGVWANQLNVLVGTNQISVDAMGNPSVSATKQAILAGTDAVPDLAIDTALLGGMYAGKINLIATEAGVGVRNAGNLYASVGDVVINANGQLENSGQINSVGNMQINTQGDLSNAGTVYAQANTMIATQGDINNSGTLAAQGDAKLNANGIHSKIISTSDAVLAAGIKADGSLGTSGALELATTEHVSAQGKNLSAGNQTITAQSVDLSGSQTSAKNLSITSSGGDITLTDAALEIIQSLNANASQTLRADGINLIANQINIAALDVSNVKGQIKAGNTLNINATGQITNTQGTLAANGQVTLNAQQVDNQSGTIGSLQNNVDIHAGGQVNNQAGYIGSQTGVKVDAGQVNNTQAGQIISNAAIFMNADSLDNQGGQIQSMGDLTLSLNGALNNHQGLVRSGKYLSLNAASIINTDTQGKDLGIEGDTVELNADDIDNSNGAIRSNSDATLTGSGAMNNTNGLISAGADLTWRDAVPNKTLIITNTGGTLIANQQLKVDSAALSGDGKILSQKDLALNLTQDLINTGQIMANGNLTLQTAGALTNQATLAAGGNLNIDAGAIDNQQEGQLTGTNLQLSAQDTLTNRGLINAVQTTLQAKTINNLDTGKIYGDQIAIDAATLNNLAENGGAAVIAARQRMDIGVETINNRQHAILFSAGDMAIGGELDANQHASGKAKVVNNQSATIEALGNLDLNAATVNNINTNFSTVTEFVGTEQVVEYQGAGSNVRYAEGTPGMRICNYESDYLCTPDGQEFEQWLKYEYTRSITETRVATTDPGEILSGGVMRINADMVNNDKSRIIAGSTLAGQIGTLNNVEVAGERTYTDTGTVTSYWRDHRKGRDETGTSTTAYNPATAIQSISLTPSVFQQNTSADGTCTQVADLNKGVVNQQPGGAAKPGGTPKNGVVISPISEVEVPAADGAPPTLVRTGGINTSVPDNSLFSLTPNPSAHYLIETDPAFANYRNWLSSDYMLNALALDPALMQKRLGDGFYEQKLLREQVAQLTGRRFLEGYASDEAQYAALMNNGVTFAKEMQLVPGVALSAAQMAALTSDIMWLVEKDVTLPDGSTTRALVPQLYARVKEGDLQSGGALIAGNNVSLNLTGDLVNSGTIAGRQVVAISADNVHNLQGRILGQDVGVSARTDLNNMGGTIAGENNLLATAGRDINLTSTTRTQTNAQGSQTNIDRVAGLYVTNPKGGNLVVNAGRDANLNAAAISNQSGGETAIVAKNDINLATVTQSTSNRIVWDNDNHRSDASQTEIGSTVQTQGKLLLQAGNDINAKGANVTSKEGDLIASAARNINLTTATANAQVDESHQNTSSGLFSSTTYTTRGTLNQSTAQASTFAGKTAVLVANNDINITGSNVLSDNGTTIVAKNDVNIVAATSVRQDGHYRSEETSGLFGSGGIGFTLGVQEQTVDQQGTTKGAATSVVGSTHGEVNIQAGHHYTQAGSDVVAPEADVNILAQRVDIIEARESNQNQTENKFKQGGLTVAITSPVISAIQTVQKIADAAGDTSDPRMKALAAASTALSIKRAANAISAGQGSAIDGKANQIATGNTNADGTAETRDAGAADKVGGINLSISIGASGSEGKTVQNSNSARSSNIVAGKNLNIVARGAGKDSDITIQGANVKVGQVATLDAEDQINMLAAQNTADQHSTNKSMSGSIGISFGTDGLLVTASASGARGNADGNDVSWSNTHVNAGKVVLHSGGDTTIKGAVVDAEKISGKIGGNLIIESLQDTSKFDSEQKSIGGSISVGYGKVGGSLSFSSSDINNDFASVAEQSGLRAGDGGFQLDVKGHTDVIGGAITSTQEAIDTKKNEFKTGGNLNIEDIQNHANYSADAVGINVGSSVSLSGALTPQGSGAGIGSDSGQSASVTKGAISGIAGNETARTGDAEAALKPIFDLSKVQKEINAQVTITQTVGQQAGQAVADYANTQRAPLQQQLKEAKTDDERKAIQSQINDISMQERALNVLVGAVTGMGGVALTRETLQGAADTMRQWAAEDSRKFPGITDGTTTLTNISGSSAGVRDDGIKEGGTRVDLDKLCGAANERCKTDPDGSLTLKNGQIQFSAKDEKGNPIPLADFINSPEGKKMGGLTGGIQGWEGTLAGTPYKPGSFVDKTIEYYAGIHDEIGGKWAGAYDDQGNTKRGRGDLEKGFHEAWSATGAIVVSTPFAMAEALPPEVWKAISILLGAVK